MTQWQTYGKPSVTQDSTQWDSTYNVLYSAMSRTHKECSDMDHTVLPANYTMPAFCFASVHQMAPRLTEVEGIWLELIYRPQGAERLSWPAWLTYSGWLTHISGYPSATGWAQDKEVRRPKDRRSTTVPRNQSCATLLLTSTLWCCGIFTMATPYVFPSVN